MTPTLKITGYVGGSYDDVIALVRPRGVETLRTAIDASEDRIARFERRTPPPARSRSTVSTQRILRC
jgi:hypothetical protein